MMQEHALVNQAGGPPTRGQLQWNCRRGIKELEVLFVPFLEHCYDQLGELAQKRFARLLGFDDASLFAWFMGYETPEDQELQLTIQEIQHALTTVQPNITSPDSMA